MKEELPRISYANPKLSISVSKIFKTPQEDWKAEMDVLFRTRTVIILKHIEYLMHIFFITENGEKKSIDMTKKWSTAILEELMDMAGRDSWRRHDEEKDIANKSKTT